MEEKQQAEEWFTITSDTDFNRVALKTFEFQYENNLIYQQFCNRILRNKPTHYNEIPFLPISFFKTHTLLPKFVAEKPSLKFKSSGTTVGARSRHYVYQPEFYIQSFLDTFTKQLARPKDSIIVALLPNYVQQGNSSLIFMVKSLIKATNHPLSGFYLDSPEALTASIEKAKKETKKIILFGVAYALLDFAEKGVDLSDVTIIETGGMKGRRKEIIREELHELLCNGLNVNKIYSEYGMTELLSQAYTDGSSYFTPPHWMKVLIRDVNDPITLIDNNKTGGVNVIDLANYYSCSFIATDDLGLKTKENRFKILGRFDNSVIRGCNLLVTH